MKIRRLKVASTLILGAFASMVGGNAMAHHSFAMFDTDKQVTLKGTVKVFQWTNPHVFIELSVPGASGTENWSIEGASPNMLFRMGWKPDSFKVGDQVSVVVNPLRSGGKGGSYVVATLPNGEKLGTIGYKP